MAVKKCNTRIIFTTSKKQAEWLKNQAEQRGISISELIRLLLKCNSAKLISMMTEEERDILFKIAQTPWLDD